MRTFLAIFCVFAAGCSATPPSPVAKLPVPVTCVKESPTAPTFVSNTELSLMTDYQLTMSLWLDRTLRTNYIGELEAVLKACQ